VLSKPKGDVIAEAPVVQIVLTEGLLKE